LTRRGRQAATAAARTVPSELARLGRAYAKAEARDALTKHDDDSDRVEDGERKMLDCMRRRKIVGFVVDGKVIVDAWRSACHAGGCVVALDDVRGL
jgi:hypothetical protein